MARLSLFWDFWMRKTIKKVIMVVPVLITSCQFSEWWNTGPVQGPYDDACKGEKALPGAGYLTQ